MRDSGCIQPYHSFFFTAFARTVLNTVITHAMAVHCMNLNISKIYFSPIQLKGHHTSSW